MPSVPQRNIYVREEDRELWEWIVAYAKAHRMTQSAVIMTAVEKFRASLENKDQDQR